MKPLVTLIMPIRNEEHFIERSLGAVLAQDYPTDRLEILVVDGMSDDDTPTIVQQMLADRLNGRLLTNPDRIVPTAMNIGLAAAQGDVIVRVDGHTVIAPDYVHRCVEILQETGVDCVGGTLQTEGQTNVARSISLAQSCPFGVGNATFRTGAEEGQFVDTLAFGAYRREVFNRIGTFDEELVRNQDDEFNYRLRAAGGQIWLDPSIRSIYYARATFRSLWNQYFQYGFYKVCVFQKVSGSAQIRHWIPPLFALAVLGGLPVALIVPILRTPYLAGLALYLLIDLAVSVRIATRSGWRHILRLPLVFPILHLSYGLGFWGGLLRFGFPWQRKGESSD